MEGGLEVDTPTRIDREPRRREEGWREEPFFGSSRLNKDRVFVGEIPEIIKRREANGVALDELGPLNGTIDATETNTRLHQRSAEQVEPSVRLGLVGLALSGGGIRSATFNLGVVQRLVEEGVLHHVDYLSTVSGGGYAGASIDSMLAAHENHPLPLRHELGRTEQNAFLHLRDFSNYLAPGGVREVLRIPALAIQGILVNLVCVLPYLLLAALLLAGFALAMAPLIPVSADWKRYFVLPMTWIAVAFLVLATYLAVALPLWQHWSEHSSPQEQRWSIREKQSNLARWALLFAPIAFILLQPAFLLAVAQTGWLGTFSAIGGLGSAGLAAALGQRAAQRFPGLADKLLVIGFALLAPISLWLLTLVLAKWLLCPPGWAPFLGGALETCRIESRTHLSLSSTATYIAAGGVLWYYAFRILDANKTSFHAFYRDRLSKAYLFDPYRDIRRDNDDGEAGAEKVGLRHADRIRLSDLPARAPYHLINAAINIQNAKTKNTRGRNADAFLFSRLYCGGELTGYCETDVLEGIDPHLDLATAMAISGAAVAPSMGVHTNRAWTFTLAMANVRLGYWLRNPRRIVYEGTHRRSRDEQRALKSTTLRAGRHYFFYELFGWLTDEENFVYVSDGGHIENLGGLELLRRRCRYIIISDAEADPGMTFNGLAHLMRLARIDLGVDITIDLVDIRREPPGTVRSHCAIGRIDYGKDEYGRREVGTLLYIKSSVTGDENEYITEYRSRHPDFPHETTGDQFFDEAQFEAYRALGYHIVGGLFGQRRGDELIEAFGDRAGFDSVEKWFRELGEWLRPLPPDRSLFIELQKQIASIERRLAEPVFASYSAEIYREVRLIRQKQPSAVGGILHGVGLKEDAAPFATGTADPASAAAAPVAPEELERRVLHLVNEQLQLMERAVLQLGLDDPRRRLRASNRGFMNLFRRWSQSDSFRRAWAVSISNYSRNLQRFSEEALDLRLAIWWTPWQERVWLEEIFKDTRQLRSKMEQHPVAIAIAGDLNDFEWDNILSHLWDLSDERRWAPATAVRGVWRAPCLLIARAGVAESPGVPSEKADKLSFVVGFAIVLDDATEPVVTYIRVRDTYRGLGLGSRLAERLGEALKDSFDERLLPRFATADDSDMAAGMRSVLERLGYEEILLSSEAEVSATE